jgi:hypothetical protein
MSDRDIAGPTPSDTVRPFEDRESERRFLERTLIDADRVMLQIIQASLSFISMGAALYSLFSGWAVRGIEIANKVANRLGLALWVLGLLLLITGIVSQARFRFALLRRLSEARRSSRPEALPTYHAAPTFLIAALLLFVGLAALVTALSLLASNPA